MAQYKCFRCMKVFEADGPFPTAAAGGSCKFCKALITDPVNLVRSPVVQGRQRSQSSPPAVHSPQTPRIKLPGLTKINLHNDGPPEVSGEAPTSKLNLIAYRGSRVDYAAIKQGGGFRAQPDARFDGPWIIRDKWIAKGVRTHMQTKAVLAWSKNKYKALEYTIGSISGGKGYLYVAWLEYGFDVVQTVRQWEKQNNWPLIDAGTQDEVLSDTVPPSRILGCWEMARGQQFGDLKVMKKLAVSPEGIPVDVMKQYETMDALFPEGKVFSVYLGNQLKSNDDKP
jgi:hypothetical protein